MPKKVIDKDYNPEEEDSSSDEILDDTSDEDSDIDNNLELHDSNANMTSLQDAQGWPDQLSEYMSPGISSERKDEINSLYESYQNSQTGVGPAPSKQQLVKINKLLVHMTQKPPTTNGVQWLTSKCEELVPGKRGKKKIANKAKGGEIVEVAESVSSMASTSIDLSQSIIPPPSKPSKRSANSEHGDGGETSKKGRASFELDNMTQAFHEGLETYNGIKIVQHPKMKRKKAINEPDEKDVTSGYGLDQDTHM